MIDCRDSWPANATAMRAWVILCYITVFCTLIEYCLALALIKNKVDPMLVRTGSAHTRSYRNVGFQLEKASKIMVPLYLIMFNTLFFLLCLYQRIK